MKSNTFTGLVLALVFGVASCSSDTSKDSGSKSSGETAESSASPVFKDENKTGLIYKEYISLKSALIKSDAKTAQVGAATLKVTLDNSGNTKGAELAALISTSSDLKVQRNNFDQLSAEVEAIIKTSGLKSGKIYKQYCPMARDGEGAYWLASEQDIQNPYYGDEMLSCGEVKEEIK